MIMKTKAKSLFFLILYISYFISINSTIIREAYHFFDIFYYKDIYKSLAKQKKSNKCSIEDGPTCLFIEGKDKNEIAKELKNLYPDKDTFLQETQENILLKLKEETKKISEKESESIEDEVFQFDSPYVMSLYLTFESYDELTKKGDMYAPETIDTQYDVGRITLNIIGKLRLSQKNAEKYENPLPKSVKDEGPKGTYAFVESKEVIVKFSAKSSVSSVYIKRNSYNTEAKTFYLYGYKDGKKQIITKLQNVPSDQWIKVTGNGKKYDSIGLLRGFDYDNFIINTAMNIEHATDLNKFTKKYSSFLNEKINDAIQDALNQLKNGELKITNPGIKVVTIDLNQNEILQDDVQEENFEIPEELMKELNKNERDTNNEKNGKQNINKDEKNINKGDL